MNRKANITLKLDVDLLRSVKVAAAKAGGRLLMLFAAEKRLPAAVKHVESYEESMKRGFGAYEGELWPSAGGGPKSRDELHER